MKWLISQNTGENWKSGIIEIQIAEFVDLTPYTTYDSTKDFFKAYGWNNNFTNYIKSLGTDLLNFYGRHMPLIGNFWFMNGRTYLTCDIVTSAFGGSLRGYEIKMYRTSVAWDKNTAYANITLCRTDSILGVPLFDSNYIDDSPWATEKLYIALWTKYLPPDTGKIRIEDKTPADSFSVVGYRKFGIFSYNQITSGYNNVNYYTNSFKYSLMGEGVYLYSSNARNYGGNPLQGGSDMYIYSCLCEKIEPEIPTAEDEQGTPTQDRSSDEIAYPSLPLLDAISSKAVKVYKPSAQNVNDLMTWLWSSDFYSALSKIFTNPMEAVLSLSILPVNAECTTNGTIKIGNATSTVNNVPLCDSQFLIKDFGYLNIYEFWGNFLDYRSNISIYLPFIGVRSLDIQDIMSSRIHLKYYIDIITGAVTALIQVDSYRNNLNSVLYSFTGNCATQIPLSSHTYISSITNLISLTAGVVGSAVTANPLPILATATGALFNSQNPMEKTGNLSANAGYLSVKNPYLILTIPELSRPQNFAENNGFITNSYFRLGDCDGFTQVEECILKDIPCTVDEETKIIEKLKEGIIL